MARIGPMMCCLSVTQIETRFSARQEKKVEDEVNSARVVHLGAHESYNAPYLGWESDTDSRATLQPMLWKS